jgi:hypothetical protein
MKVQYSITPKDAVNFYKHFKSKGSYKFNIFKRIVQVVAVAMIIFLILTFISNIQMKFSLPYGLVMAILIIFLIDKVQISNIKRSSSSINKNQVIEITDPGVQINRERGNVFVRWDGIIEVSHDTNGIYLFTNPKCAFIVPRRCFKNEQEFIEFIEQAKRFKRTY